MRTLLILALTLSQLGYSQAFNWKVTVLDQVTREEKTYRPDQDSFKFKAGSFQCEVTPVQPSVEGKSYRELRDLFCGLKSESRFGTRAVCMSQDGSKDLYLSALFIADTKDVPKFTLNLICESPGI